MPSRCIISTKLNSLSLSYLLIIFEYSYHIMVEVAKHLLKAQLRQLGASNYSLCYPLPVYELKIQRNIWMFIMVEEAKYLLKAQLRQERLSIRLVILFHYARGGQKHGTADRAEIYYPIMSITVIW